MKMNLRLIGIAQLALILTAAVCHAEDYYTVKVYSMLGDYEYKAMSRTEYGELVKKLKKENMQFSRAQRLAEAEWNKDKDAGRYPGRALHQRKVMKIKSYKTLQAAEDYIMKKEEAAAKSEARKQERKEAARWKNNRGRENRQRQRSIEKRQRQKEESAEKRKEKLEKAQNCLMKQLNTLLNPGESKKNDETVEKEQDAKKQAGTNNIQRNF